VFKERCHILLSRRHQNALPPLKKLGERLQVAVIRLAGQWTQSLFHAKICLIVLQEPEVIFNAHTFDYPGEKR
jgi:hypothetical protein